MKRATIAASILALACGPALAQAPAPSLTMRAPCTPAETAVAALKRDGFVRVAKGRDGDGDPFVLYRRSDGGWQAVAMIATPDGSPWVCRILTGDGLVVDPAGTGA